MIISRIYQMELLVEFHELSRPCDEKPHCYILKVDEFRILLDCGWDENFNQDFTQEISKQIDTIDAVLLSHPDIYHLGALPYVVGKLGLSCPIFATFPVYQMGQMCMYDVFQSRDNTEDFDLFTLDDIDAAFDRITQLQFCQTVHLQGKGLGISIKALRAGHMVGGSIWKIEKDGELFFYAVDCNHEKERHLNAGLMATIHQPSVLITDVSDLICDQFDRNMREHKLMDRVRRTLQGGGNVLMPVDAAGRVLELASVLDGQWQEYRLLRYSLVLLSNVGYNAVEFAKCQLEWMSDEMVRGFENTCNNPFMFKHVKFCHSLVELEQVSGPKLVMATCPDMECGFSREIFKDWCSNQSNGIILTTRTCPGSLARRLMDCPQIKRISLIVKKRVRIEIEKTLSLRKREMCENKAGNSENLMEIRGNKFEDVSFGKIKSFPLMFPFEEKVIECDDYGEKVYPQDLLFGDFYQREPEEALEEEEIEETLHVPTKCVQTQEEFDVNCSVDFVDFEGRSDGVSIREILSSVLPHRMINVRGLDENRWQHIYAKNNFVL